MNVTIVITSRYPRLLILGLSYLQAYSETNRALAEHGAVQSYRLFGIAR